MASEMILTNALRSTLQNIQKATNNGAVKSSQQPQSNASAQGAVQDVADIRINPADLNDRAKQLQDRLDHIHNNVSILNDTFSKTQTLETLVREADQIVGETLDAMAKSKAGSGSDLSEILSQASQAYNAVLAKIDETVGTEGPVNLLRGAVLETEFINRPNTGMVTQGGDFSAEGVGLEPVQFQSVDDIAGTYNALRTAIESVKGFSTALKVDLAEISTKESFAAGTVEALQAGVQSLDSLGQAEEGANLLALQASQLLADSENTLVSEEQKELLNLF